jgi:hypothetical protein
MRSVNEEIFQYQSPEKRTDIQEAVGPHQSVSTIGGLRCRNSAAVAWGGSGPANRVEIDHTIEFTAADDPGVDLLTHALFLGSVESDRSSFEQVVKALNISPEATKGWIHKRQSTQARRPL